MDVLGQIDPGTWATFARWGGFLVLLVCCVRFRPWRWLTPWLRGRDG